MAGVYQPPNNDLAYFTQFITGAFRYKDSFRAVFTGSFNLDVFNCIDVFHQCSLVNETNLPTFVSPSDGTPTSLFYHIWHKLNGQRGSYVVSTALSDRYTVCIIFKARHDSPPKTIRFGDYSEAYAQNQSANFENEFVFCSLALEFLLTYTILHIVDSTYFLYT